MIIPTFTKDHEQRSIIMYNEIVKSGRKFFMNESLSVGCLCKLDPRISEDLLPKEQIRKFSHLKHYEADCFLIIKFLDDGTAVLAQIHKKKRKKTLQLELDGESIWIVCDWFINADPCFFVLYERSLHDEKKVVSSVFSLHDKLKKQWIAEKPKRLAKAKARRQKKKADERMWKQVEGVAGSHKSNNKKYPFGSGIARRSAPGSYIHVVSGGRVSPR